jgi:DNA-binding NtrC family response regulator
MAARVLVVDDDTMVLNAVSRSLRLYGYDVYTASAPKVALEMVPALGIEVVVSDLEMPEMHGDALCREVKKIAPNVGFILHSGSDKVTRRAIDCGASYGFLKPVEPAKLREAVAVLIEHRRKA